MSGKEETVAGPSPPPHANAVGVMSIAERDFLSDLLNGMRGRPRSIPAKYFYDERGSALFEAICDLPEYYLTRTELAILGESAAEIATLLGPRCLLIEYGSGSSAKVRPLLDQLEAPAGYVPIDVSTKHLHALAAEIARDYPALEVTPLATDFTRSPLLPPHTVDARRVVTFPGSTIGNLMPNEARDLLAGVAALVGRKGAALIGVDLAKSRAILEPAYNDAAGVTAEFNRNVLRHANRVLGADFVPDCYNHRAFYDEPESRIEMHLEAIRRQIVTLSGERFVIEAGEHIRTEYSYKYTVARFTSLAGSAGLSVARTWIDSAGLFSIHYVVPDAD